MKENGKEKAPLGDIASNVHDTHSKNFQKNDSLELLKIAETHQRWEVNYDMI